MGVIYSSYRKKIHTIMKKKKGGEEKKIQAEKKPLMAARQIWLLGSKTHFTISVFSSPTAFFTQENPSSLIAMADTLETKPISSAAAPPPPSPPPPLFFEFLTLLSYSSATSIAISDISLLIK